MRAVVGLHGTEKRDVGNSVQIVGAPGTIAAGAVIYLSAIGADFEVATIIGGVDMPDSAGEWRPDVQPLPWDLHTVHCQTRVRRFCRRIN